MFNSSELHLSEVTSYKIHILVIQSLAFFLKKVAIFRKNLKTDNFLYSIKDITRQNKELKYRRKNIVWIVLILLYENILK